jgi:adenine-specific DNA-methyltransferase
MAKIEELIAQVPDERLRNGLAAEVKALKKTKKFGLVFEEHLPETVRLPLSAVKIGDLVALKRETGNQLWRVRGIREGVATCNRAIEDYHDTKGATKEFPVSDLVVVRNFGDPIYPALVPVDRVARGGPDKPWHLLINADNFHALQLLLYCYEGGVDVIYIDPPYNTGARDWKYNNDYVDKNDTFRHSKWLSMLKKRLALAKRLLKPSGVLIVTIDEHEVHHLGVLLEEHLPEYARQVVTIVINEKGVAQGRLSRVEEYAFFCFGPEAEVPPQNDDLLSPERQASKRFSLPRWEWLLRGGTNSRRADRKKLFFPVYVDPSVPKITGFGEPLPFDEKPKLKRKDERRVAWPFRTDGSLGNWRVSPSTLREYQEKGYVKLGGYDADRKTWTLLYLGRKAQKAIETGAIRIKERDPATGAVSLEFTAGEQRQIKTVWHRGAHDSGTYGSTVLRNLLGEGGVFAFPKSLYAVRDTLRIVSSGRPDALIVDFFGGSGTTLHATALLNSELGGKRKCILVTNNELTEKTEKSLTRDGFFLGDAEFEKQGVAESVAWPRCKASVTGKRADGTDLPGTYLSGRELKEGFDENVEYFRLEFLDPAEVARGDAFQAILPILWMIAGCIGSREGGKASQSWFIPKHAPFAVLIKEKHVRDFRDKLAQRKDIDWVFLVTDSEENFGLMRRALGHKYRCVQLYKSYLENFRLNTSEALGEGLAG